jgi:hypothetical protein
MRTLLMIFIVPSITVVDFWPLLRKKTLGLYAGERFSISASIRRSSSLMSTVSNSKNCFLPPYPEFHMSALEHMLLILSRLQYAVGGVEHCTPQY